MDGIDATVTIGPALRGLVVGLFLLLAAAPAVAFLLVALLEPRCAKP